MKYEPGKPILDPRAFLQGGTKIWANQRGGKSQPVMYGTIIIPTRLIDFVYDNSYPVYMGGERALMFNHSYWESNERNFLDNPPDYDGKVGIYLRKLKEELREEMRKTFKYNRM